jgi:hypothetical protein
MVTECDKTAGSVHANAFSVIGIAAGVVIAIAIGVLAFVVYDGWDYIMLMANAPTEATGATR